MKNILKIIIPLFFIILLSSCIKDGEILENCFRKIRIEFQWIDTDPLLQSENVNVAITSSGGTTTHITSNVIGRDVDLAADTYTFVGYETEQNVAINEKEGTVSLIESRVDIGVLEPTLFSAGERVMQVEYLLDSLVIPIPMYQQTRPLIVEVLFEDKSTPIINEFPPVKDIIGTLSGITYERAINDGFVSVEEREQFPAIKRGDMIYDLDESEESRTDRIQFLATHNLLGLDGASHMLELHVEFENGISEDFTFDVTDKLKGFHTERIHEPWYIIITLKLDSSLAVSVVDWIAGPDSWLNAVEKNP